MIFKKDDKVKCVDAVGVDGMKPYKISLGSIYTVLEETGQVVRIAADDNGKECSWYKHRFELHLPPLTKGFKIGDRVRCIDAAKSCDELSLGLTGTVQSISDGFKGSILLRIKWDQPGYMSGGWFDYRFELIDSQPKQDGQVQLVKELCQEIEDLKSQLESAEYVKKNLRDRLNQVLAIVQ